MPRVLNTQELAPYYQLNPLCPQSCAADLDRHGFDPQDEESTLRAAAMLEALGRNTDFLAEHLVAMLGNSRADQDIPNAYGAQAIMLSAPRNGVFLRANIWPAEHDSSFRRSGGGHNFAYGAPHDHNFDFLTYGYFGPGYESDYYEIDHSQITGELGEEVALRFIERSSLNQGKVMHYRAHRDVHSQIPPQSLSVSLNIMSQTPEQAWHDQFLFDESRTKISAILSENSSAVFLRAAIALGDENAIDLAQHWGKTHPNARMRLVSFSARAESAGDDLPLRDAIWQEAENSGSRLVAQTANRMRRTLQQRP